METRDALLHAIDEEYVEAVEVLLENEEMTHKEGELHVSTLNTRFCRFDVLDSLTYILKLEKYFVRIN